MCRHPIEDDDKQERAAPNNVPPSTGHVRRCTVHFAQTHMCVIKKTVGTNIHISFSLTTFCASSRHLVVKVIDTTQVASKLREKASLSGSSRHVRLAWQSRK